MRTTNEGIPHETRGSTAMIDDAAPRPRQTMGKQPLLLDFGTGSGGQVPPPSRALRSGTHATIHTTDRQNSHEHTSIYSRNYRSDVGSGTTLNGSKYRNKQNVFIKAHIPYSSKDRVRRTTEIDETRVWGINQSSSRTKICR